jgi:hypothetical protein
MQRFNPNGGDEVGEGNRVEQFSRSGLFSVSINVTPGPIMSGWLVKLPPGKSDHASFIRSAVSRSHRRWVACAFAGGVFTLEYFTDADLKNQKGEVEGELSLYSLKANPLLPLSFQMVPITHEHGTAEVQTDASLVLHKQPPAVLERTYVFAAESEEDFQKWWKCLSHPGRCTLPVHVPGEASGWVLHTTIDGEGPGHKPQSARGERRWADLTLKGGLRLLNTEGGKPSHSSNQLHEPLASFVLRKRGEVPHLSSAHSHLTLELCPEILATQSIVLPGKRHVLTFFSCDDYDVFAEALSHHSKLVSQIDQASHLPMATPLPQWKSEELEVQPSSLKRLESESEYSGFLTKHPPKQAPFGSSAQKRFFVLKQSVAGPPRLTYHTPAGLLKGEVEGQLSQYTLLARSNHRGGVNTMEIRPDRMEKVATGANRGVDHHLHAGQDSDVDFTASVAGLTRSYILTADSASDFTYWWNALALHCQKDTKGTFQASLALRALLTR